MIKFNLLKPNFEPCKEIKLETIEKGVSLWSFKKPFEFKTFIKFVDTDPVLTIKPTEIKNFEWGDSEEERERKGKNNNLFIKNHHERFRPYFNEDFGWIFYKYIFKNRETIHNPYYMVNDDEYIQLLNSMERNGEIVEMPKTKTFCVNAEAKINLEKYLGNNDSILDFLVEYMVSNFYNNFKMEVPPSIEEQLKNKELQEISFYVPLLSALHLKQNANIIELDYNSPLYKLPLDIDIINFEREKLKLITDYFKTAYNLLENSKDYNNFKNKLNDSNALKSRSYVPSCIIKNISFVAQKIKNAKEIGDILVRVKKMVLGV